jgi:hypothetical protein
MEYTAALMFYIIPLLLLQSSYINSQNIIEHTKLAPHLSVLISFLFCQDLQNADLELSRRCL